MSKGKRFLDLYGWILIILFCGCLYTLWVYFHVEDRQISNNYFGITVSLWYLMTGIGILTRKKWGYYLFKSFLYILILAFPIGTIISYKSLAYMKENAIKNFFGR